jgi:2-keto-4-pentenoate hydratase/2-oxohepta-3-ene-1,7-dioic acid hydratase in catechol pathway
MMELPASQAFATVPIVTAAYGEIAGLRNEPIGTIRKGVHVKLVSFRATAGIRLGRVDGQSVTPFDYDGGMIGLINAGKSGLEAAASASGDTLPLDQVDLAPPVIDPSKIIAIGLNYRDHAAELGMEVPASPMCFAKYPCTLAGHGDEVCWSPDLTAQVDYEAELVVVIGKNARRVDESSALGYVFGYSCGNDVSARDLQMGDVQWVRGKSLDTFGPVGPWIVTADEITDPQTLDISSTINGKRMQSSNTRNMAFTVAFLIHFYSQAFTLSPGDLIFTGTPGGIGLQQKPPVLMKDGDVMKVEVEGIGRLVNTCRTV